MKPENAKETLGNLCLNFFWENIKMVQTEEKLNKKS